MITWVATVREIQARTESARLRWTLRRCCPTESDLDAFCLEYFPEVHGSFTGGQDWQSKESLLLAKTASMQAELTFALFDFARGRGIPGEADLDPEGVQDELLARVLAACRIRERHREKLTLQVHSEPGAALRVIEVAYTNRRFSVRYGLGATDQAVDPKTLRRFETELAARFLGSSAAAPAQLVFAGPAPDAATSLAGEQQLIEVLSLEDYESLLGLGPSVQRQTDRLAQDLRYPPSLYVPQRMQLCRDASFRFGEVSEQALEEVMSWLRSPHSRFVLLLGDFGTGKTFLLYELVRRLGQAGGPLIPLLCELRQIEKAQDLSMLLVQHMRQAGIEPIDPEALLHMLELGRVVLCFDGFDELALRTSFERASEHLETLLQAVRGQAKVVVTSRTQHFLNDQQIKTVLGQRLERVPCYVGRLTPFERPQILQYLRNRLSDEESAQRRYRLLDEIKDLLGLSQNPRMLGFIAQIEEPKLLEAQRRHGAISAAGLYQLLVDDWLEFEIRRRCERVADRSLTRPQLLDAVTRLALRLWQKTEATAGLAEIESAARGALEDIEVAAHQVGSASLLVRDPEGRFSFLHQSVLEWLVARAAAVGIQKGTDSEILGAHDLSELMAEFLIGLCGREAAAGWAARALELRESDPATATRKDNAWLIFRRLGQAPPGRLNLSGQNLGGRDFARQELRFADLSRANLRAALLVDAKLQDADLRDANLSGADLRRADLRRADLRCADLHRANLIAADLRGAKLEGARLDATKLIGVRLDEGSALAATPQVAALRPQFSSRLALMPSAYTGQCVAWSPDGSLLALGMDNGAISLLDNLSPSAGVLRSFPGASGEVHAVAFSPDGKLLAGAYQDGTIWIWEVERGEPLRSLRGHGDSAFSVAFSPDGELLASASLDKTVRLWRMADGTPTAVLQGHEGSVFCVAFSPRGNLLASGSGDRTVRLWSVPDGAERAALIAHEQAVWSVAFSPSGELLAGGSWDKTVRLWKAEVPLAPPVTISFPAPVNSIAFSPVKDQLAVGLADGMVRLVASGAALMGTAEEKAPEPDSSQQQAVLAVAWSPSGAYVAGALFGQTVRILREERDALHPHMTLRGRRTPISEVSFSADGQTLFATAYNQILCFEVATGVLRGTRGGFLGPSWCLASSADGRFLAAGLPDHSIRIWTLPGEAYTVLSGHEFVVSSLAFSPDGELLASTSFDHSLRLWRVADGRCLSTGAGFRTQLNHVRWSPDGKQLVVAAGDELRLFRLHGEELHPSESLGVPKCGFIYSVVFSPDGERLAFGSEDRAVHLLRMKDRTLQALTGHGGAVGDVAFSPDGRLLGSAARDGTVTLWSAAGERLVSLRGHEDVVYSVTFSPDGRLLGSASLDGTVRLWSVEERRCLAVLLAGESGWVSFLPDGRYKSGGEPESIVWHVLGRCRFELGELDELIPGLRLPDGAQLVELQPFVPQLGLPPPPVSALTVARVEGAQAAPVAPAPAPVSAVLPADPAPAPAPVPSAARAAGGIRKGIGIAGAGILGAALLASMLPRSPVSTRGLAPLHPAEESASLVTPGRSHAVLFATTHYNDPLWPQLRTPAPDATEIGEDLRNLYGFEVERIDDPRVEDIRKKIRALAERSYAEGDQLFIMFSGHGDKDETLKKGWIVARDSRADERQSAYPYSELREDIDNIPCRHILLVLDVCFGGSFDPSIRDAQTRRKEYQEASTAEFIKRKLRYRSRLYISSVDQRTEAPEGQGHSPFTWRLLEALRSGGGQDGVLTWNELVGFLEKLDPEPRGGVFPKTTNSDPGGDFLFLRKGPAR